MGQTTVSPHEHTLSCHRGDARDRSFIVGERPDAGKAEGRDHVARRKYRGDLSGCGALLRFRCSNLPRFFITLRIPSRALAGGDCRREDGRQTLALNHAPNRQAFSLNKK